MLACGSLIASVLFALQVAQRLSLGHESSCYLLNADSPSRSYQA